VVTSPDYYKTDPSWMEDTDFTESYQLGDELILRQDVGSLMLLVEG
jgi:hypothetical protein